MAIEHIGSTAVPGLAAKPIIDIALVVPSAQDFDAVSAALLPIGYRDWPYPAQRLHMKTTNRVRTHHVHAVGQHSDYLEIHRDFRDYLRSHPESAAAYERLKRELVERYRTDRETYAEAKTAFVMAVNEQARRWRQEALDGK